MISTPEQCCAAAAECGAPMVSVCGGEPLIHPAIDRIVSSLVEQGRFVYLCTNAILLERKLDLFRPKNRAKGPMPVILWFHGGGWSGGAKPMLAIYCRALFM